MGLLGGVLLCSQARADWDYHHHHDWDHRHEGYHDRDYHGFFWAGVVIGATVAAPPPDYVTVVVRGHRYFYYEGVYYQPVSDGYVIVNPPAGAVISAPPPGYTPVVINGVTYYQAGGVYYLPQPSGYTVVTPPAAAPASVPVAASVPPPPPPAPAPAVTAPYELGRDWAKDLRDDIATREQFVDYLKSNFPKSSSADYNEFRRGFVAAYGVNAEKAFDKAYQQAHK